MQTRIIMLMDDYEYHVKRDFDGYKCELVVFDGDFIFSSAGWTKYKNLHLDIWRCMAHKNWTYSLRIGENRLIRHGGGKYDRYGYSYNHRWKELEFIQTSDDIQDAAKEAIERQRGDREKSENVKGTENEEQSENNIGENQQIFNRIIEENAELYAKVSNKEFFRFELNAFWLFAEDGEIASMAQFFEQYIKWEECFEHIRANIKLETVCQYFPDVNKFLLSDSEMENFLALEKMRFDLYHWIEGFDIGQSWLFKEPRKEFELQKVLSVIYEALYRKNDTRKLQKKYTLDNVLERFNSDVQSCENFSDMKYFLGNFLEEIFKEAITDEKTLRKKIETFFDDYRKHEKEYKDFIKRYGCDYYIIRYTEEKEARYQASGYTEEEKEEALFFNEAFTKFKQDVYISKTTNVRPYYKELITWRQFTKELIMELLNYQVLLEADGKVQFNIIHNLKEMEREQLQYSAWLLTKKTTAFVKRYEEKKAEKQQRKQEYLRRIILADEQFYVCTNQTLRFKFLRNFISKEYKEGKDNFFYCLDAYTHERLGVCFKGNTAKNFIESIWKEVKAKKL